MSNQDQLNTEPLGTQAGLVAQIRLLEAENERLRERLADSRRARHRKAALSLATMGAGAIGSAILFPVARDVLLALGGTGLFAAVLIIYLTPERFVSAAVGERIFEALESDRSAIISELELREQQVYLPIEMESRRGVRLFVPQYREYERPSDDELGAFFVTPSNELARGVAFEPTGYALYDELRRTVRGGFTDDVPVLATQVADGIAESLELVETATADVEEGRVSVAVTNSAYGPVDRLDHPVASVVGVTLAAELGTPVTMDVTSTTDADYLITGRWE
ncbi:hypothetical protein [Natronorarus salvus]|uniref:hypothetical protein n=1 Tax=Natronorarus salvus TaxID=3117733 RepID=UPI002F264E07